MMSIDERPKTFDDMIGHKDIIKEMKERSKTMDFPSVMLFSGASGTGKTTLALMIASILSEGGVLQPDGTRIPNVESACSKAIYSTRFSRDVIFRDASQMSKEDVANMADEMMIAPMFDKRRVLILDECQALSRIAKGALLVLLEKVIKNSYLILCTMDESTIDPAIISRCSKYTFKPFTERDIAEYLYNLCVKKGVPQTEDMRDFYVKGLPMIASHSNGSVRQAVQDLDRCISGNIFSVEMISSEFSVMDEESKFKMINSLMVGNAKFWESLDNLNADEDFYKTLFGSLVSAYIWEKSGYYKSESQEKFCKSLSKSCNLEKAVELLGDSAIYTQGYFQKNIFRRNLVNVFFNKSNSQNIQSVHTEQIAVRPKRVAVQ